MSWVHPLVHDRPCLSTPPALLLMNKQAWLAWLQSHCPMLLPCWRPQPESLSFHIHQLDSRHTWWKNCLLEAPNMMWIFGPMLARQQSHGFSCNNCPYKNCTSMLSSHHMGHSLLQHVQGCANKNMCTFNCLPHCPLTCPQYVLIIFGTGIAMHHALHLCDNDQ